MQSLSDRYTATHSNTHETFADLVFCALVVLVLFVMAMAIEVSQRVRAELVEIPPIEVIENLSDLTKEEVKELGQRLQEQQEELRVLQRKVRDRDSKVANKLAALAGEQRFTGAREPASIGLCYDYAKDRFHFAPAKDVTHADRRQSGETIFEYGNRKTKELVELALKLRRQRGYTLEETIAIYSAFSTFREIVPDGGTYSIKESQVGINYHVTLCGYVAGDETTGDITEAVVVANILKVHENVGRSSREMYPKCLIEVDPKRRKLTINGVTMSAKDLQGILLSISGRGAMLDFEGYNGAAPAWLREGALIPSGYVGKTPKLPGK